MEENYKFRCFLILIIFQVLVSVKAEELKFDLMISATDASTGLNQFAQQTNTPLIFLYEDVQGKNINPIEGTFTFDDALKRLLDDTGITGTVNDNGVLIISAVSNDLEKAQQGGDMKSSQSLLNRISKFLLGGAALLSASNSVNAQTSDIQLEEIVVTAQQRQQSLQEVPISLEVVTGEEITKQGYRNLGSMQGFIPTLNIDPGTQNQTMMIRGTGTQGSNFGLEQAVGIFVDGIHFGRASQIHNAFLDIERIEILRGPQPIFFGQNTSAGAIGITTKKPTPVWEGRLVAEYGSDDTKTIEAGIGGPISNTLGVRIAGIYDSTDGHLTDTLTGTKFPHKEVITGRAIIQWTPADEFNTTFKVEYSELNRGGAADILGRSEGTLPSGFGSSYLVCCFEQATLAVPIPEGIRHNIGLKLGPVFFPLPPEVTRTRNRNQFVVDASGLADELNFEAREESQPWNAYLKMNYLLGNEIELMSQTGYSHHQRDYVRDFGRGGPYINAPLNRIEDLDQWSQEFRITSPVGGFIEWMAGLYYQKNEMDHVSTFWVADTRRNDGGSQNNNEIDQSINSDDAEWKSAFATVTFNFMNDMASIDLGARYTDVEKFGRMVEMGADWIVEGGGPITASHQVAIGHTPFMPSGRVTNGTYNESVVNPQIVLRYRPTENISTYAKYAQGFKAGGFDTSVVWVVNPENFQFDNEDAENWEAGVKGKFLDGRATADLSVFWSEFEGLQYSSSAGEERRNRTQNVASQRVRGAEFQGRILFSDRLSAGIAGALIDGEMLSFPGANCTDAEELAGLCIENGIPGTIDRSGNTPPRLPDWEVSANLDYWMPVLESYKVTFNAKAMMSDGYITDDGWDQTVKMDPHEDLNLTLGFGDQADTWNLSIWGRNLLEPQYTYHPEFDIFPDGTITANSRPSQYATYGLQFRYNYQ